MRNILLILLTCLPAFAQTSLSPLTLRLTDFPQSSPVDTVQIFSRNYAATDGLAGLVWRMENSGFAGLFPTSDSFARMSLGHIQPLTTLDIRGTPVSNAGLFYMNDQHTFTGSSGTGPEIYGAAGQQLAWSIGVPDSITADNSYFLNIDGLNGLINGTQSRGIRFGVSNAGAFSRPLALHHTGFLSLTDPAGAGGNAIFQFTDAAGVFQGDTNASGAGGSITITPAPTKGLYLQGGLRYNYITASGTFDIATNNYIIEVTVDASVLTLPDASDVGAGKAIIVRANSGVTATVEGRDSDTINGAADDTVSPLESVMYVSGGVDDWKKIAVFDPGAGGSSYDTIEEEGTPLAQESTLNFVGSAFTASAGSGKTLVTSDADVDAVASASGTGIQVRTGAGTLAQRTVASANAAITVANGDGVSGNPTLTFVGTAQDNVVYTKALVNNMNNNIITIPLPNSSMAAQDIFAAVLSTDTSVFLSYAVRIQINAVRSPGGTPTVLLQSLTPNLADSGVDGMSPGLTWVDNTTSITVVFDPGVNVITPTTCNMQYRLQNYTGQTITIH